MNIKVIALCLLLVLVPSPTFPMISSVLTLVSFALAKLMKEKQKVTTFQQKDEKESKQSWSYWETMAPWLTMGWCDPKKIRDQKNLEEIDNIRNNVAKYLQNLSFIQTPEDPQLEVNFTKLKEAITHGKADLNDSFYFADRSDRYHPHNSTALPYVITNSRPGNCGPDRIRFLIVEYLVKQGANSRYQLLYTLYKALDRLDFPIVKYLVTQNGPCGELDKKLGDKTPLHYVLDWDFVYKVPQKKITFVKKMVDVLIKNGASFAFFKTESMSTKQEENILENCVTLSIERPLLLEYLRQCRSTQRKEDTRTIFERVLRYGDEEVFWYALKQNLIDLSKININLFLSSIVGNKKENIKSILRIWKKEAEPIFTGPYNNGNNLLLQACDYVYPKENKLHLCDLILSLLETKPDLAKQINNKGETAISSLLSNDSCEDKDEFAKNVMVLLHCGCPLDIDERGNNVFHQFIYACKGDVLGSLIVGLIKAGRGSELKKLLAQPNKQNLTPQELADVLGGSSYHRDSQEGATLLKHVTSFGQSSGTHESLKRFQGLYNKCYYDLKNDERGDKVRWSKTLYKKGHLCDFNIKHNSKKGKPLV
jgi:hypothetical protein